MGALFTVQNLNDGYARRFRDRYFAKDTEIVWYSRETGVTGTSVNDEAARALLSAYFNAGSALFDGGTPLFRRDIDLRGTSYAVTGIPLRTSEGTAIGSLMILVPSRHDGTAIIFAALIMLLFFVLEVSFHMYALRFRLSDNRHMFIVVSVSLALFFLTFWGTRAWLARQAVTLKKTPQVIYNSTLGFVPEYDSMDTRFERRAAIVLQSGGEAINAVEATIAYDPSMIEVRDIITANSFCDPALFLERNIDSAEGIVRVACIVPTPGFSDSRGVVAELLFQPRREGFAALTFASGTRVLANDGLGTDVLRAAVPASYQMVRAAGDTARAEAPPILFSYTHPNQERWYRNREVRLAWMPKEGYRYHYVLNQIPDLIPSERDPSAQSRGFLQLTAPNDGVYYIHVRPERNGVFGETAHYKVMIDTTPPLPPVILASSERVRPGDVVRFEFKGEDAMSGVQSGYYVKINEGFLLPVRPELYIPFLEEGTYALTVRVFDKAGNARDATEMIEVRK